MVWTTRARQAPVGALPGRCGALKSFGGDAADALPTMDRPGNNAQSYKKRKNMGGFSRKKADFRARRPLKGARRPLKGARRWQKP